MSAGLCHRSAVRYEGKGGFEDKSQVSNLGRWGACWRLTQGRRRSSILGQGAEIESNFYFAKLKMLVGCWLDDVWGSEVGEV